MTLWYENGGKQCEGRWNDGLRVGTWQAWHENGQLWVQGEFVADEPVGTWQYYDERGRPSGQRVDGVKTGDWREWNRQRDTLGSGPYEDGRQHGAWSFQNKHGQTVLELTYRQGVVDGPVVVHQGVRVEYWVEKSQEQPSRRRLTYNGRSYSGDDPITGKTLSAFDSPQFPSLQWFPLDGPFDPKPRVTDKESWQDGQPRHELACKLVVQDNRIVRIPDGEARDWYASGQRHREQAYLDGLPHGKFSEWYENGKPTYELEFLLGQPTGRWTFWYEDGQMQAQGTIRSGFEKEDWTFWNPDGSQAATPDVWDWIRKHSALKGDESLSEPANPVPTP